MFSITDIKKIASQESREVNHHINALKRQLNSNLKIALKGCYYWHSICRTKGFNNTAVVLIPDEDKEISYYALLYLDNMLEVHHFDNAIILTIDSVAAKAAPLFSKRILSIKVVSRKESESLIKLYSLIKIDDKFFCVSLDKPEGRKGSVLIGQKGVTKEELLAIGIYNIYPIVRPKQNEYIGNDSEVLDYIVNGTKVSYEMG